MKKLPFFLPLLLLAGCVPEESPKPSVPPEIIPAAYRQELPQGRGGVIYEDGVPLKLVVANETVSVFDKSNGQATDKALHQFDLLYLHEKQTDGWVKVSFSKAADSSIGWIKIDNIDNNAFPWLHRVGWLPVQMSNSQPLQLPYYTSPNDAQQAKEGRSTEPAGMIDLIPFDSKRHIQNPFPILEINNFNADGKRYTAYKIAMLGRKSKSVETATKSHYTKKPNYYTKDEVKQMRHQLKTFDIFVVIDTTESMSDEMDAAKRAVAEFSSKFNLSGIDAKFSLTTYRDACDGDNMLRVYPAESINDFCSRLDRQEADGGGDNPEAGYPALAKALQQADYRERSERILLLVGDAPFHTKGKNNPDKIDNEILITASKKHKVKVFVLDCDDKGDLGRQVAAIAKATGGKCFSLKNTNTLLNEITGILKQHREQIDDTANVFDGLSEGKSPKEIAAQLGKDDVQITNIVRIIQEKGIDTNKLSALSEGKTIALTGWVVPFGSDCSSGTLETLLFRVEAEEVLKVMQEIIRITPDAGIGGRIWNEGAKSRTQENESITEILFKKGVPFGNPSVLNNYSLAEIQRLPESERVALQDKVYPLIRKLDGELKESVRWQTMPDGRKRGWISEECLP